MLVGGELAPTKRSCLALLTRRLLDSRCMIILVFKLLLWLLNPGDGVWTNVDQGITEYECALIACKYRKKRKLSVARSKIVVGEVPRVG